MPKVLKNILKSIPGILLTYRLFKSINPIKDHLYFKSELEKLSKLLHKKIFIKDYKKRELILVCGNGMEILWLQLWLIISLVCRDNNYRIHAISTKKKFIQNLYLKLAKAKLNYIEDIKNIDSNGLDKLKIKISKLNDFDTIKNFSFQDIPLGKMAISTYCRQKTTGILELENDEQLDEISHLIVYLMKSKYWMDSILKGLEEPVAFFTELFMEEYGGIYYSCIKNKSSIVQFAGTVRDNSFIIRHLNKNNDRTHFSSMSEHSKNKIFPLKLNEKINDSLNTNFEERYSQKWLFSSRNHPNTLNINREEARKKIGISPSSKVAIIYSHILYDTLFFNGEDLYKNYAEWFVETVKLACNNKELIWFIKIHPSNLWRGEINDENQLASKYEEIRLIEENIGELPKHVRIIYPDSKYSPLTWLRVTDYGVTVRGTSGIELAALGKLVVTAGTGRYESLGITNNPSSIRQYQKVIANLHNFDPLSSEIKNKAIKFAYFTFCMKPYNLKFLNLTNQTGFSNNTSSVRMKYLINFDEFSDNDLKQINKLVNWIHKKDEIDLLNEWET